MLNLGILCDCTGDNLGFASNDSLRITDQKPHTKHQNVDISKEIIGKKFIFCQMIILTPKYSPYFILRVVLKTLYQAGCINGLT